MSKKIRVAIVGASGKMGRQLIQAAYNNENISITAAIDRADSSAIGKDAGELASIGNINIAVTDKLADNFDILIDFTRPEASLTYLDFCSQHNKKMIIGTTGFSADEIKSIEQAAKKISIVFSSNYSIGVNLVFKLLEKAAKVMGDSDIEIIEAHHKHKVDAPSGTALSMGKAIASSLGKNLDDIAVFERHGLIGERKQGEIGFSTIRAADVVGEHAVWFAAQGERVEIAHKASSRMTFASGAIKATLWVANQPVGLFSMTDVLNLNEL